MSDISRDDTVRHLALTKIGLLMVVTPFIALNFAGPVSGILALLGILVVIGGAALWGYGYGRLLNTDTDRPEEVDDA